MAASIPFSWFSEENPDHMRNVVEFATNLPCLTALTTEEIRARLEEELSCCPAQVQRPGGVITGWGQIVGLEDPRTGSAFHSHDAQAILLDVGPRAEYVLDFLVAHVRSPTREECQRIFTLQDREVFQHYHQDLSFRVWLDHCAARAENMASPPGLILRIVAAVRAWMRKRKGDPGGIV